MHSPVTYRDHVGTDMTISYQAFEYSDRTIIEACIEGEVIANFQHGDREARDIEINICSDDDEVIDLLPEMVREARGMLYK